MKKIILIALVFVMTLNIGCVFADTLVTQDVSDYCIISVTSGMGILKTRKNIIDDLSKEMRSLIKKKLDEGWCPLGNMIIIARDDNDVLSYFQVMVKIDKK